MSAAATRRPLRVLSVCSGIGAAELGFGRAGMEVVACADIEGFPNAVRAIRFPGVPNLGDMTKFREWPAWGPHLGGPDGSAIDVLVGGTPCQSFSIAGLRKGLDDPRGNLALTFLALVERYRPVWVVWENVPGVRSSWIHDAPEPVPPPDDMEEGSEWLGSDEYESHETAALGCFFAGLVECGYGVSWRSLDAQYFGVPQRRERVFAVGHRGDGRCAAAVLLEPESLRRAAAPRRIAGQGQPYAGITAPGAGRPDAGGGACDGACDGAGGIDAVAGPVLASTGNASPRGDGSDTLIVQDVAPTLAARKGSGMGTDFDLDGGLVVTSKWSKRSGGPSGDECGNLVAFSACDDGSGAQQDVTPALRVGNGQRAGGGQQMAVAFDIRGRDEGARIEGPSETAALRAASGGSSRSVLAVHERRDDICEAEYAPDVAPHGARPGQGYTLLRTNMSVRRIMPLEAERLQGFPDGWTAIPWRGKAAQACPDGPRYRALGNSMAVPVMQWIGRRIVLCDEVWTGLQAEGDG